MSVSKFQRGESVFTCECGKRTRVIGDAPHGTCEDCWDNAGWDNQINDEGYNINIDEKEIIEECFNGVTKRYEEWKEWYLNFGSGCCEGR